MRIEPGLTPRCGGRSSRLSASASAIIAGLVLVACAPSAGLAEASGDTARSVRLEPCGLDGFEGPALCGALEVPENGDSADARLIRLRIVVLPATGPDPLPDPIVLLAGGPGQAATAAAESFARRHARSRYRRDLLMIDQRGTGGSHPLECESGMFSDPKRSLGPAYTDDEIERCRDTLSRHADLRSYTTEDAARDLDAVRTALGYPTLNLDAGSYGTRLALVYMKRYPERIRTASLSGLSPTDYRNPLPHAKASQAALERLFANCAADPACDEAYPRLADDFSRVQRVLANGPVQVETQHPTTGEMVTVEISSDLFAVRTHLLLFSTELSRHLPHLVHEAARDRWEPFVGLATRFAAAVVKQLAIGMQLSVVCSEDHAGVTPLEIREATEGTYLGTAMVERTAAWCALWPEARLPLDFFEPTRSSVPALLLTGELDPATPPRFADRVARHLAAGRVIRLPNSSHLITGDCAHSILAEFINEASTAALDVSCVSTIDRPPYFVPDTP